MRTRKPIVLLLCSLLLLSLLISGCSWVENVKVFKDKSSVPEEDGAASEQETVIEEGLDLAVLPEDAASGESGTEDAVSPEGDTKEVLLYFASEDGRSLQTESRAIPKQEGIARATVNQLIAGPQSEELLPTLPASAILEDINIRGGVCTVDFSMDLLEDLAMADTQSQLLAVYSVVNTLTQFDSVDTVQILVNGQIITTGVGGVDVSEALAPVEF